MHEQTRGYEKRWYCLGFLMVSLLIIALDNTVLNVAIPSISTDLGASASELQWIIDAYVLDFAKHAPAPDSPKISLIWDSIPP